MPPLHHEIVEAASNAATLARPLFNMYGWTHKGGMVPTQPELSKFIQNLIEKAIEYGDGHISSGRFTVLLTGDDDHHTIYVSLDLSRSTTETLYERS